MKGKTIKTILISAVALAFLVTGFAQAQDAYQQAQQAYKQGNWNNMLKYSQQVVAEYQDWFPGHYLEGLAYYKLKRYDNAVRSLTRALDYAEGGDQSFQAKFYIAKAYYDKGDFQNALKFIESAERHSSTSGYKQAASVIAGMKGYSSFNTGKYKEAIAAFKPIVDSGKATADTLRAVAKAYQELGQNKQAIDIINQVVRKDPKDRDAHYILIKSYFNDKNWRQVIAAADQTVANLPNEWEALYLKAYAQEQLGQHSAAETTARRSLAISSQDRARRLLGDILGAQGKYREAALEYERAQKSYGNDFIFYQTWAYYWIEFVPKNTEDYKGKPQENAFKQALNNAEEILKTANKVQGADKTKVAGLMDVISNKKTRLEQGATYVEVYEYRINPETGEVEKIKIDSNKDK
jgi:tetratricopeptide (TPR) repeat protein